MFLYILVCFQVGLWEVRLSDLDEYLLSLNTIQRRWVYLEPIFGRGALPREEARFKRVDEDFRYFVIYFESHSFISHTVSNKIPVLSAHVPNLLFKPQGMIKVSLDKMYFYHCLIRQVPLR